MHRITRGTLRVERGWIRLLLLSFIIANPANCGIKELQTREPYRIFSSQLPIYAVRDNVIQALETYDFLIVVGETGWSFEKSA